MGFASFGPCTSEPVVTSVSRATFPAPCDGLAQESTAIWQLLRVNDAAKETRISHSDPFFFFAEVPIKHVLLGLGKRFKKFARINRASYQFSGKKKSKGAHFPASPGNFRPRIQPFWD